MPISRGNLLNIDTFPRLIGIFLYICRRYTDNALSLQKNTTQSHKLQNDQGKTMIAKDSFVPLL